MPKNLRFSVTRCQRHPVTEFRQTAKVTIGSRIKQRREALGMSVATLAKKAGLAISTLYDIERGDQHSSTKLHAIATALVCNVNWLETGKGLPDLVGPAQLLAAAQLQAKEWPFAVERQRFDALPDHLRGKIEGYIDAVIRDWEMEQATPAKKRRSP